MNELPDVLNTLIASLKSILSSYMEREEDDLIDFGNEPFHEALSYKLGAMLNLQINIHDEAANQFCVDSIIPRVGMVSEGGRFTCWGIIYWLSTPKDYPINKSGKDPFYCAFESDNGQLRLLSMCCGDYNLTNVEDAMSMISNKEEDERGTDNSLRSKELYKLTYDQLSDHNGEEGWENTIRVTSSGVFIHPGEDYFWFGGCKGVTCNLETSEGNEPKTEKSESISALQKIRDLYDEQCNLTGNKFLLKPNSRAYDVTPVAPNQTVKKYKP